MAKPTVEESELKAAGNQIPHKRLENGKEVTGWLNHSLANNCDRPRRRDWLMRCDWPML